MKIAESINDKNTLKAVFLAGGPGCGKSYVASNMFEISSDGVSFEGIKLINIDIPLEKGLSRANLPMVMRTDNKDLYKLQMEIREWARKITNEKHGNYINSLLPLLIDGTGKNFEKIKKQADTLRLVGYDVSMVFVNTSLEVALERNNQRERSVDPTLVKKMWNQVQANIGKFQRYFGRDNMIIIDNSESFKTGSVEAKEFANDLSKAGRSLLNAPLKNPIGRANLNYLRKTGGKYLSDLASRPILSEKTLKYVKR